VKELGYFIILICIWKGRDCIFKGCSCLNW